MTNTDTTLASCNSEGKGPKNQTDSRRLAFDLLRSATVDLKARGGGIYRYEPETGLLVLVVQINRSLESSLSLPKGEGLCGHMVAEIHDFLIVPDYERYEHRYKKLGQINVSSAIGMTIYKEGTVLGAIFLEQSKKNFFKAGDKELLRPYAEQLADLTADLVTNPYEGNELESLTNAPIGIIVVDRGRVRVFNWAASKIFGWTFGEIVGKPPTLFYKNESEALRVGKDLREKGVVHKSISGRHKDGRLFQLRLTALSLGEGKSIGYVENIEDLDAAKREAEIFRKRFEDLSAASAALLRANSSQDLIHEVANRLLSFLGAWWISIMVIDREGNVKGTLKRDRDDEGEYALKYPEGWLPTRNKEGLTHRIVQEQLEVVVGDISKPLHLEINPVIIEKGVKATLGLPFLYQGFCYAAVWIHFDEVRVFTEETLKALRLYLSQAAFAYEAIRATEQQRTMLEVLDDLYSRKTLTGVERILVDGLARVLEVPAVTLGLRQKNTTPFLPGTFMETATTDKLGPSPFDYSKYEEDVAACFRQDRWETRKGDSLMIAFSINEATKAFLYISLPMGVELYERDNLALNTMMRHAAFAMDKALSYEKLKNGLDMVKKAAQTRGTADLRTSLKGVVQELQKHLHCSRVGLEVFDPKSNRTYPPFFSGEGPWQGWEDLILGARTTLGDREDIIVDDVALSPKLKAWFEQEGITTLVAVPLRFVEDSVGTLILAYDSGGPLEPAMREMVEMMGNLLANLVANALLAEENRLQQRTLKMMRHDGKIGALDINKTLKRLVDQGSNLIEGEDRYLLVTWMEKDGELVPEATSIEFDSIGRLDLEQAFASKVATCFSLKQTIWARDIKNTGLCHFFSGLDWVRSELVIPIFEGDKVLGIFNILHSRQNALEGRIEIFEALVDQAGIAIQSANLYRELQNIGGYIGKRTVTEWLFLLGATWGHDIKSRVGKARAALHLMELELEPVLTKETRELIGKAYSSLGIISDIPLVVPLASEDRETHLSLVPLVEKYFSEIWVNHRYNDIKLEMSPKAGKDILVRASGNWLYRLFEIILDNGVRAMRHQPDGMETERVFTVTCECLANDRIEVRMHNNGPAVPLGLRGKIFEQPIQREEGSFGSGLGLVLARIIAERYDGYLFLNKEIEEGAEFVLSLPLIRGNQISEA